MSGLARIVTLRLISQCTTYYTTATSTGRYLVRQMYLANKLEGRNQYRNNTVQAIVQYNDDN